MEKTRILFLASNPSDSVQLGLDREIRMIKEAIRSSEYRDMLELNSAWAVRPADLLQSLNIYKPHVVHFSGHGSGAGEIILVDEIGEPKPVGPVAIRTLFATIKDSVRLVIMNSCYSLPQAQAITEVIDYAIGMNGEITDTAAITFVASMYQAIGFGHSISQSFEQGRVALLLEGIPEEHIPQLMVRNGVSSSTATIESLGANPMNASQDNKQPSEVTIAQTRQMVREGVESHTSTFFPQTTSSEVHHAPKIKASANQTEFAIMELKIDRDFASYTNVEQQQLLKAISGLLNIADDLRITKIRPGSVIVSIELPKEKVQELFLIVKAGLLEQFRVSDAKVSQAQRVVSGSRRAKRTEKVTGTVTGTGTEKVTGTVKWFNDQKGFGFIEHEGGTSFFVHHSAIISEGFRSLAEGDQVEFTIEQGPKGPSAANIKKL